MPRKKQQSPPQKPSALLPLSERKTCEDSEVREELEKLYKADRCAVEMVSGGVLLGW